MSEYVICWGNLYIQDVRYNPGEDYGMYQFTPHFHLAEIRNTDKAAILPEEQAKKLSDLLGLHLEAIIINPNSPPSFEG